MARQKIGRCVHFDGLPIGEREPSGKRCRAGVDYRALVGGPDEGWACRAPCITTSRSNDVVPCTSYRDPTPDEIAESEAEFQSVMNRMRVVMTGIAPWRKAHKGQSFAEVVECPACKGRLHLSIAAYNGHVHGHCETAGCASWME